MVGCGILVWTLGRTGGMWNPGLDPGQDRWDPALDPRWDVESWVGPWAGQAGSRLGSQVGGGILPRIPVGGDPSFDPGRDGRDPALDPGWEAGSRVGPRAGMAGSQVGLAGSRLNPAWLLNWGFCRHHSILKSYLTTIKPRYLYIFWTVELHFYFSCYRTRRGSVGK